MITDGMKSKGLAAFNAVVMKDGKLPLPKDIIGAVIAAVAPDIRNAALEEAAAAFDRWGNIEGRYAADTTRALKTKVTP